MRARIAQIIICLVNVIDGFSLRSITGNDFGNNRETVSGLVTVQGTTFKALSTHFLMPIVCCDAVIPQQLKELKPSEVAMRDQEVHGCEVQRLCR